MKFRASLRAPKPPRTPVKKASGKVSRPKPPASKAGYTMKGKKLH